MALTNWKGSVVRKQDITIAKNYLSGDEIDTLNRLVVIFLETAELRVKNRIDINIEFWKKNIDRLLEFNDKLILADKGSITHKMMEEKIRQIYDQFDLKRKKVEAIKEDELELIELEKLEDKLNQR